MSNEASIPADDVADATPEATSPSRQKPQKRGKPQGPLGAVWRLFTSFGLAVVVLLLMTILTLIGTLEQTDSGLFDTQEKYFNSFFVLHKADFWVLPFAIPIPLPGGYLLMAILFFNVLSGAIVRARKNWRYPGMLIAHSGILLLLFGSAVSYHFSTKGYMALSKGEVANQYMAYQGWQLEVIPLDDENRPEEKAFVITEAQLKSVGEKNRRSFTSENIPFEIEVADYLRNSVPVPVTAPIAAEAKTPEWDGIKLLKQDPTKEAEGNLGGAYVTVRSDKEGVEEQRSIVWAGQSAPFVVEVDGRKWALNLDRPRWDVPFDVRLDQFIFDRHPGTSMARKFESRITKIEGNSETPVQIRMNEPLRDRGYTLFQESYGPPDESDPEKMWSQFSVVKNPTDQWPIYSLVVIGLGMLFHFIQKLVLYILRHLRSLEREKTARAAAIAAVNPEPSQNPAAP